MNLTLQISPEAQARIERAAHQSGTDVADFILQAATEKAARVFDEAAFSALLESDPDGALDYLLEVTPDARAQAGLAPLSEEQVSRAAYYED